MASTEELNSSSLAKSADVAGLAKSADVSSLSILADTMVLMLSQILNRTSRVDANERQLVNIETGNIGTVSAITAVGAIQGFSGGNANSVPYNMSNMGANHLYNQIKVS